jgi:D-arabinose 1-dehydrogenase-like Zn-dependent alcohol dehydrogenase
MLTLLTIPLGGMSAVCLCSPRSIIEELIVSILDNCEQCWTGIEQWCRKRLNSGIEVTGTYQQYIVSLLDVVMTEN